MTRTKRKRLYIATTDISVWAHSATEATTIVQNLSGAPVAQVYVHDCRWVGELVDEARAMQGAQDRSVVPACQIADLGVAPRSVAATTACAHDDTIPAGLR